MRSDRLLELAAHLKSDRRGHKRFSLNCYSTGKRNPEKHGCGSVGCALGELPVVWPNDWEFGEIAWKHSPSEEHGIRLKSQPWDHTGSMTAIEGACEWFDLEQEEVGFLFYPDPDDSVHEDYFPDDPLPDDATAEQVADRLIAFVKWREEETEGNPKFNAYPCVGD